MYKLQQLLASGVGDLEYCKYVINSMNIVNLLNSMNLGKLDSFVEFIKKINPIPKFTH